MFSLSNMSGRTLPQFGKCPPLDDHIDRRWIPKAEGHVVNIWEVYNGL